MALPTFGAAGSGAATTSTGGIDVPYPAGITAGDILILHLCRSGNGGSFSTPSGWAAIASTTTEITHYAFWKAATGSESGNLNVTGVWSSSGAFGRMYRFSGAGASVDNTGSGEGTTETIDDVGVTTSTANRLAVNLVAIRDNLAIGSFSGETGGDWTEAVAEFTSSTGNDACLQVQTADMVSAGTVNGGSTTVATAVAPGTNQWSVIAFSLPAATIVQPAAAVATASGPTPTVSTSGNVSLSPAAASATASSTAADASGDVELYAGMDFGGGFTSFTDRLRTASLRRGRPFNLDRVEAGTASVVFKDGDGHLDPTNSGGPHYGNIFPLVPLRLLRREGGVTYERFYGPVERYVPQWYPPRHKDMGVDAADSFEALANIVIVSDQASLTTALSGANNDLTFTAVEAGGQGDDITVTYVVAGNNTVLGAETNDPYNGSIIGNAFVQENVIPLETSQPVPAPVVVQGSDITVNIGTDGGGAATSTAAEVKTALEAVPEVAALVTIAHAPGSSGAGVVTALATTNLSGGKWAEESSGDRIDRILTLAGWTGDRAIDDGEYRVIAKGYSVRENVSALQAIQDTADSELGYVFMRGDNTFVYHDVAHRATDPRSTASRATFANTGSGFRFQALEQSYDKERILNEATVTGGLQTSVPQTAADTYSQTGTGTPPVGAPNVPPTGYGPRAVSRNTLLADDEDAARQAESIVAAFAYPRQRIESITTMEPSDGAGWVEAVLGLEIGDLVTVVVTPPSTDGDATTTSYDMFVEEIADDIGAGLPWTVTLRLSPATQSVAAPPDPPDAGALLNNIGGALILDDSTDGKIG